MNDVLIIKDLTKKYQNLQGEVIAIDKLSLNIKDEEFIAIVGPSGCGKSSLLSILCGIEDKTGGSFIFPDTKKNKLGYMLQNDSLFPWLTILDNCLIGLKVSKKLTFENISYVKKLLEMYGLRDFMYNYPSSLSGGMRQRVALIRTLAIKPDILLLYEPFSALDYQTRLAVSDDVYQIIKKEHKTAIMVTHDLAEAISIADRVVVLTNRPATVKKIFEIKLTNRKNPIENRKCVEFSKYYEDIWKELDFHV